MLLRIVKEYDRGVIFFLGKVTGVRGSGLIILIPLFEQVTKVSLHTITMNIPPQRIIMLPEKMQRAMELEAEAERESRANIVAAEVEFQGAVKLGEAADIIALHPFAHQLRTL